MILKLNLACSFVVIHEKLRIRIKNRILKVELVELDVKSVESL